MMADRFDNLKPGLAGFEENTLQRSERFISLRWRLLVPLFSVLLAAAMIAAYVMTATLVQSGQGAQTSQIQLAAIGTQDGMQVVYADLNSSAMRVAYLSGLAGAIATEDTAMLQRTLSLEAAAAGLDAVVIVDELGRELVGIQRDSFDSGDFDISTGADLSQQAVVQSGQAGAAQLMRTSYGYMQFVAQPIMQDGGQIGQVLAGVELTHALDNMRGSGLAQLALYGPSGDFLQTTFSGDDTLYASLTLTPEQAMQALFVGPDQLPVADLMLNDYPYHAVLMPYVMGADVSGVLAVYVPASVPYAANLARQMLSLSMALVMAVLVIATYAVVAHMVMRIQRVTKTAHALIRGDIGARTHMQATDEISEMGLALDAYADRVKLRQDALRASMRRQRSENARLVAIFESFPDGVVVQDLDGRVLLMNDKARELLGSQRVFRTSKLNEITAAVTDVLGPAIAPGVYALGEPQRVTLDETILSAQAAAVLTISGRRIGSIIVVRDISLQVKQEQAREDLLNQLSKDIEEPLMELVAVRSSADADPRLQRFAYEVMRSTVRLQRLIAQLRDVSDLGPEEVAAGQQPIALDQLLTDITEQWQPTAIAGAVSLQLYIQQSGLHCLGDERRLRWAIGNMVDNAVKYTLPEGRIALMVRGESEQAIITVQDTGVGIEAIDLPHIFTRFFRGTPRRPDGTLLRVPGLGQGLFITQRIVEAHGGTVTLQSAVGKGTAVTCSLPLTSPVTMTLQPPVGVLSSAARREAALLPVQPPTTMPE